MSPRNDKLYYTLFFPLRNIQRSSKSDFGCVQIAFSVITEPNFYIYTSWWTCPWLCEFFVVILMFLFSVILCFSRNTFLVCAVWQLVVLYSVYLKCVSYWIPSLPHMTVDLGRVWLRDTTVKLLVLFTNEIKEFPFPSHPAKSGALLQSTTGTGSFTYRRSSESCLRYLI